MTQFSNSLSDHYANVTAAVDRDVEFRERALSLAIIGSDTPEQVVERARIYLAFLKGDATGASGSSEPPSSGPAISTEPSAPASSSQAA